MEIKFSGLREFQEAAEGKYGDVEYADTENKKYPIDTEEHIRAAWNYIHQEKNAAGYPDKGAAIKSKIISAWKSKIDKDGPPEATKESMATPEEKAPEALANLHKHAHTHPGSDVPHSHDHAHAQMHDPAQSGDHTHDHAADMQYDTPGEPEPDPKDPNEKKEKAAGVESEKPKANIVESDKIRTLYVSESVDINESTIDKKAGTIAVTLIKPGWSKNGRYYGKEMLARTAKVWEGARAFGDHAHPGENDKLPERSVFEQVGYYSDARYEGDAVKATLKLVGDETRKAHILDWAEESIKAGKPFIGLSINALGKTKMGDAEGRKGVIIEDIAVGNSVDIVTRPAAGGSFDTMLASDDEFTTNLLQNLEYNEWVEAKPDYVARIKNEMRTARKDELNADALTKIAESDKKLTEQETAMKEKDSKLAELTEEVNRVTKEFTDKLAESAKRVTELVADQKLAESKLPKEFTESLKPQMLDKTPEDMDVLIAAEKAKFFAANGKIEVENPDTRFSEVEVYQAKMETLSNKFGLDASKVAFPNENYAQWNARTNKGK